MKLLTHITAALLVFSLAACQSPSARRPAAPGEGARELQIVVWPAADDVSPLPHCVFGQPRFGQDDPSHAVVRQYGAFTVYYDDRVLAPRWAAIKLTRAMVDANNGCKRPARFLTDPYLRQHGYEATRHEDYTNPPGERTWDRGHMVQFDDARGYGDTAAQESMYTTNICPQLADLNQEGWLALEQRMTQFARDYGRVWIIVGPIYGDTPQPFAPGRRIPAPAAFYRIAVRQGDSDSVEAVGFIMPHTPIPRDADLQPFIVPIREIEERTGLDFLHELPDRLEQDLESRPGVIWPRPSEN